MTVSVVHTRTHLIFAPANPHLFCATCGKRVEAFHDDACGCGEMEPMYFPCGCHGDYDDLCPSWSPVDGCTCREAHR